MRIKDNIKLKMKMGGFLYGYYRGLLKVPYNPLFVYIEPTDNCNFKCVMCPHGLAETGSWEKGQMSMSLFEPLIVQLKEFRPFLGVCLHLGGEPLLNKNLEDMIGMGAKNGIGFGFSTNGYLLTNERIKSLVDVGLEGLRIDFSADKEKYEKACPGGIWEVVYENIRNLAQYRDKAMPGFKIRIKDLCLENEPSPSVQAGSMRRLKGLFSGVRIDRFETFEIHNWSGEFAARQVESGFHIERVDRGSSSPCSHLWFALNIKHDGRVVPCCRDLRGDVVLGDAIKESLADIWNGEKIMRLRDIHSRREFDKVPLCKDCDRPWTGGKRGGSIPQMFGKYIKRLRP
ncbi:MAG: SPASM domain-containing protein [Deltaproteobacteria bacterium]|nr:SPASM domain-containing protein [Deltaproteobacteria bacterium]